MNLGCPIAEFDTDSQESSSSEETSSSEDLSPPLKKFIVGDAVSARVYPILPNLKITYLDSAICNDFGRDPKYGDRTFNQDHLTSEKLCTVSRLHFRIEKKPLIDNLWYITDHSSNGTFLNGRRMASGACEKLENGMKISMGRREVVCFRFQIRTK